VLLPGTTEHGDLLATQDQLGGLAVYPLTCAHCGFVRLHALEELGIQPSD
jgi:hypothetical protein